eukprot:3154407-Rhodomonas_salina.1
MGYHRPVSQILSHRHRTAQARSTLLSSRTSDSTGTSHIRSHGHRIERARPTLTSSSHACSCFKRRRSTAHLAESVGQHHVADEKLHPVRHASEAILQRNLQLQLCAGRNGGVW